MTSPTRSSHGGIQKRSSYGKNSTGRNSTSKNSTGRTSTGRRNSTGLTNTARNSQQANATGGTQGTPAGLGSAYRTGTGNSLVSGQPSASNLPIYTGKFPALGADKHEGQFGVNSREAIGFGSVVLASMFDLFHPGAPHSKPGKGRIAEMSNQETVLQKTRTFIVVHKFEDRYIALPVYTYKGKGMMGRADSEKALYLHVRDGRRYGRRFGIYFTENPNDENVYALMKGDENENSLIPPEAWCKLHHPISMSMEYHKARILGRLTEPSSQKLFVRHYLHAFKLLASPQQPLAYSEIKVLLSQSPQSSPTASASNVTSSTRTPRASPSQSFANLSLTSPSKRPAIDEADDPSSSRSSKRQLRSSGSGELMQLDEKSRSISQPRDRGSHGSGAGAENGVNITTGTEDSSVVAGNLQVGDFHIQTSEAHSAHVDEPNQDGESTQKKSKKSKSQKKNNANADNNSPPTDAEIEMVMRIYREWRGTTIDQDSAIEALQKSDQHMLRRIRKLKAKQESNDDVEIAIAKEFSINTSASGPSKAASGSGNKDSTARSAAAGSTFATEQREASTPSEDVPPPTQHEIEIMFKTRAKHELTRADNFRLLQMRDFKNQGYIDDQVVEYWEYLVSTGYK